MIETVLQSVGALALGIAVSKGGIFLWKQRKKIQLKNPIRTWVRKEVLNYLKELQDER